MGPNFSSYNGYEDDCKTIQEAIFHEVALLAAQPILFPFLLNRSYLLFVLRRYTLTLFIKLISNFFSFIANSLFFLGYFILRMSIIY